MGEFKARRFVEDQKANKMLQYHAGRFSLSPGGAAFPLIFFANGTDGILSVETMGSFFRNQTFLENWYRRANAGGFEIAAEYAGVIQQYHLEIGTGSNNDQGVYIFDNVTEPCPLYDNLASDNLPAILLNTTGVLKKDVDTLLQLLYNPFKDPSCPFAPPRGPAGV